MSPDETGSPSRLILRSEGIRRTVVPVLLILVMGAAIRFGKAPQFGGLDDIGYLEAAQNVSRGTSAADANSLFYLRTGMSYPLGWLMRGGFAQPTQFWILTIGADIWTMVMLFTAVGTWYGSTPAILVVGVFALYPLSVGGSTEYMPTAFQNAAVATALCLLAQVSVCEQLWADLAAFAAGLAIGLGYLFKEDVALLVPAVIAASLLTGQFRIRGLALFAAGSAGVFLLESLGFFLSTGNLLHRLQATSGAAAPVGDDLNISAIWKWHGFVRPLLAMPYQVGLYWWVALAAWIWSLRRGDRTTRFIVLALVLTMLYLQFGSNSLTRYIPLPKGPRYTAIVTPFLAILLGWFISSLWNTNHRKWATAVAAILFVSAVPCIVVDSLVASERTRNVAAAANVLAERSGATVYTDYFSARLLRCLVPKQIRVADWFHANLATGKMNMLVRDDQFTNCFVLVDHQNLKMYTSNYSLKLPVNVEQVPSQWELVWTNEAYPGDGWQRRTLQGIASWASILPDGFMKERIQRNVADMIEGDRATLYYVPQTSSDDHS